VYRGQLGETPGLPSGRGSGSNPIALPGLEVKPDDARGQLFLLLLLLLVLWAASEG
jgi:hypothetical protein